MTATAFSSSRYLDVRHQLLGCQHPQLHSPCSQHASLLAEYHQVFKQHSCQMLLHRPLVIAHNVFHGFHPYMKHMSNHIGIKSHRTQWRQIIFCIHDEGSLTCHNYHGNIIIAYNQLFIFQTDESDPELALLNPRESTIFAVTPFSREKNIKLANVSQNQSSTVQTFTWMQNYMNNIFTYILLACLT